MTLRQPQLQLHATVSERQPCNSPTCAPATATSIGFSLAGTTSRRSSVIPGASTRTSRSVTSRAGIPVTRWWDRAAMRWTTIYATDGRGSGYHGWPPRRRGLPYRMPDDAPRNFRTASHRTGCSTGARCARGNSAARVAAAFNGVVQMSHTHMPNVTVTVWHANHITRAAAAAAATVTATMLQPQSFHRHSQIDAAQLLQGLSIANRAPDSAAKCVHPL